LDREKEIAKKSKLSSLLYLRIGFSVKQKRIFSFEVTIKKKGPFLLPRWFMKTSLDFLVLVVVLLWCGILFNRIMEKPLYSIILVIGILIIIYGGKFVLKDLMEIEKS
jgi:hypothetical protein